MLFSSSEHMCLLHVQIDTDSQPCLCIECNLMVLNMLHMIQDVMRASVNQQNLTAGAGGLRGGTCEHTAGSEICRILPAVCC